MQSPINLDKSVATTHVYQSLEFMNYNMDETFDIRNTDKGVSGYLNDSNINITITQGPLSTNIFQFVRFDIHWGSTIHQGSEHTIDQERYDMEIQLVHFNAKYVTYETAKNNPDGLAIYAILFSNSLNTTYSNLTFLSSIKKLVDGDFRDPTTMRLDSILSSTNNKFFTYFGSLTIPPCSENVRWIIASEIVGFPTEILENLRKVKDNANRPIYDNFRYSQPIQLRNLYTMT